MSAELTDEVRAYRDFVTDDEADPLVIEVMEEFYEVTHD
ncbi:DUF7215 family protein [Kineococcus esterisolvens]